MEGGGGGGVCVRVCMCVNRKEDVRAFDIDSVEIYKCFRPGDVLRAAVISLGDSKSYYLSTARNELGVILANSTAGMAIACVRW